MNPTYFFFLNNFFGLAIIMKPFLVKGKVFCCKLAMIHENLLI